MKQSNKRGLLVFLMLSTLFLNLGFSQAQDLPYSNQKNLFFSSKEFILNLIKKITETISGFFEKIGKGIFSAWKSFHQSIFNFWKNNILPAIKEKVEKKVEERKPIIKEEFQKEKEEMTREIINLGKAIWENLKDIVTEG
jgi:hypothetical protein